MKKINHCDSCKYSYIQLNRMWCKWHDSFCSFKNVFLKCRYHIPKEIEEGKQ